MPKIAFSVNFVARKIGPFGHTAVSWGGVSHIPLDRRGKVRTTSSHLHLSNPDSPSRTAQGQRASQWEFFSGWAMVQ